MRILGWDFGPFSRLFGTLRETLLQLHIPVLSSFGLLFDLNIVWDDISWGSFRSVF